ncbi:MAG: peptide deformylase [Candidatus Heimdallarchaeota archaeon]|nr:MAG: peptide deformylase [Candidatus Heimdallarchaeota archaeon]
MAIKEVLIIGNPELRERSSKISDFGESLQEIIEDLKDTLTHLQKTKKIGRALAAPQIGHMKQIIYYGLPKNPFVMVNPEITSRSEEKFWVWDSCFSFDVAFFVEIKRHKEIKIRYQDENGKIHVNEFDDDMSELIQHETDHLHGILATDHLTDGKRIILRQEWEKRFA